MQEKSNDWTLVIKPRKRLLDLDLKGLWRYRDLWYMYVRSNIFLLEKVSFLTRRHFFILRVL